MNSHLHFCLLEGEIDASDLCLGDLLFHLVIGKHAVECVALDQLSFLGGLAVSFQNVDGLDRVTLDALKTVRKRLND